mgnify:CR=1 FL=1
MGCAAGCANSNVHEPDEPELKGSKGHITMAPMGFAGQLDENRFRDFMYFN